MQYTTESNDGVLDRTFIKRGYLDFYFPLTSYDEISPIALDVYLMKKSHFKCGFSQ